MNVSATVRYNSDHERTGISVDAKSQVGIVAQFSMDGETAVLTEIRQREGESDVYGESIDFVMGYVEDLPFVQAVTMDEYEPLEEQ